MIKTEFMELLEELDRINEATDEVASKKFWAAAKEDKIDEDAFHAAFDAELTELRLIDMFDEEGVLVNNYGRIADAKKANPDSWALKALGKLWALRYKNNNLFKSELAKRQAELDRYEQEREEAAQRKAEEERLAKERKEVQLKEFNELLQTYISKVDPTVISNYEKLTNVSVADDISIQEEIIKRKGFKLCFTAWGRCYTNLTEQDITDEAKMVKLITQGLTDAAADIQTENIIKPFKQIDVIQNNPTNYITIILLGESGTLYEVKYSPTIRSSAAIFRNSGFTVSIDGKEQGSVDIITEPYEIIYTYVNVEERARWAHQDSISDSYYSWNSRYAAKLKGKLPTEYGRKDRGVVGYSETKEVDDGYRFYHSHEDGIDSWAVSHTVSYPLD